LAFRKIQVSDCAGNFIKQFRYFLPTLRADMSLQANTGILFVCRIVNN